jgi:hypothetical protein
LAVNKWDAVDDYQRTTAAAIDRTAAGLPEVRAGAEHFGDQAPGLGPVWKAIADAHASATRKMSTPVLTRLLLDAVEHQAPQRAGMFRPKLRYAHQGGMNPPIVVVHGNSLEHVTDAYKRFLEGRIRDHFKLTGTPLRIEMRSGKNPFDAKGLRGIPRRVGPGGSCVNVSRQFIQHGEYREQQRSTFAGSLSEPAAQRARSSVHLLGERHQAARPHRIVRPVRGPVAQHRDPDGLQARHFHGGAGPRSELPRSRRSRGGLNAPNDYRGAMSTILNPDISATADLASARDSGGCGDWTRARV